MPETKPPKAASAPARPKPALSAVRNVLPNNWLLAIKRKLGNGNARSGPNPAPTLIRNLSGSLDEFELFSRALSDAQIRELYAQGKPESGG